MDENILTPIALDLVAMSIAEKQARDSGVSVSDWMAEVVLRAAGTNQPRFFDNVELASGFQKAPSVSAHEAERLLEHYDTSQFEGDDPAVRSIHVFNWRMHSAAILLSTAFAEADVSDFTVSRRHRRRVAGSARWFSDMVDYGLNTSREVRNALVHRWKPTPHAERLAIEAFVMLCDLTPVSLDLMRLCRHDRVRAFSELAKFLALATSQVEISANLVYGLERRPDQTELRAEAIRRALLEAAGGGLSLTEGAGAAGVSRQAMHSRIRNWAVLGMMDDGHIVLPRLQFETLQPLTTVGGLQPVLLQFRTAGAWSALQFLSSDDPNLGETPISALRKGRTADTLNAAMAYNGDEDA